ncbi:MAG: hypothetical protein RIS35_2233, partial [Pseudomonadota bacterium]
MATCARASPIFGGIFDYDAKKARLEEVDREFEAPDVWNDPKRAQDLGREKKSLEDVVIRLGAV